MLVINPKLFHPAKITLVFLDGKIEKYPPNIVQKRTGGWTGNG
jgi:hypothetical protein